MSRRDRVSRNDPCPCGSGLKFKKCCYHRDRGITPLDRALAIELIEQHVDRCDEQLDALDIFYGNLDTEHPRMEQHFRDTSESAFDYWFAFDFKFDDGSCLVDRILKTKPDVSEGERRYLEQMRTTAMMPYEVTAVRPGKSIVLRRLGSENETEVREKTASQHVKRWDMLVARLNPVGPTGGPEIEMGAMMIPPSVQGDIEAIVHDELGTLSDLDDYVGRFKELGAIFHRIWLATIVDPEIPTLQTSEGDPVVYVKMVFDVNDEQHVRSALNVEPSLNHEEDSWDWSEGNSRLGNIQLSGSQLTLQTDSEPRADRGRELIERIAQDAIVFRSCDRVDAKQELEKAIRSGKRPELPQVEQEIPPEIQDQLYQEFMAKHNQEWLDEQIPALDLQTPRFAAKSPKLLAQLVGLLKDQENQYLRALAAGAPAFDPSWMWAELGLADHADAPGVRHPLSLAHESMEQHVPGIAQVVRSLADRRRGNETEWNLVTERELQAEPPVQDLIRSRDRRVGSGELLGQIEFYGNYEMQRRKTFWVDESLAWMLGNTKVDAEASLLRLPFSSYVLVYTDRYTLSLAERALASDSSCRLRGQMLAVMCAYVVQLARDGSRIKAGLTFDAFAGQPPLLMSWELGIDPEEPLEKTVADALARTETSALFRPLLDTVINATLYTTSAGVKIEQHRVDAAEHPNQKQPPASLPSGSVYHLPGKIAISQMRKLQQLARGPTGRTLMHRFMVRGHWRRPNPNWHDQSLRWIEPYWRGPSLASIVERQYRLNP